MHVSTIKKVFIKYRELLLYAIIGGSGASLDFIIYTFLSQKFDIHYQISNVISVSCGILNNFLLNTYYNFKTKDKLLKRFILFYSIGFFGLGLSAVGLFSLVDMIKMNEIPAKVLLIPSVALIQFILNKYITYRKWN